MKYEQLRNLREDRDLTQKEVGEILGVSQRAYSSYENGDRTVSPELLSVLADYYNTSVDYLMGRTDINRPYPGNNRKKY